MNLSRMIIALSASHAIFTDEENWGRAGNLVEFTPKRCFDILQTETGTAIPEVLHMHLAMCIADEIKRTNDKTDQIFNFTQTLYLVLESLAAESGAEGSIQ